MNRSGLDPTARCTGNHLSRMRSPAAPDGAVKPATACRQGVGLLFAFGLALLAGLWPVGLAAILAYLDRAPPLRHAYAYLAGAAVTVSAATVLVLFGLSAVGATPHRNARLSGGVTLALGLLACAFALALWRRRPAPGRRPVPARPASLGRSRTGQGALAAFALGLVMWLPSPVYLAAVKSINDSGSGTVATALSSILAIILLLWIVEIPIVCYLISPVTTRRWLHTVNGWLIRQGRALVAVVIALVGLALTVAGVARLLA